MPERFDATSLTVTEATKFILAERTRKYKPARYAALVPINTSIPEWADTVEIQQTQDFASVTEVGTNNNVLPLPTFEKETLTVRPRRYGAMYTLVDRELERAKRTGTNVSARSVLAIQAATEQFLDTVMATGGGQVGMTGLLNQAGATVHTGEAGFNPNTATPVQLVDAITAMVEQVWLNTDELYQADSLVIPSAWWYKFTRTRMSGDNGETVMQAIQAANPGLTRIGPWGRANAAGASSKHRVAVYNSDPAVLEGVIQETLHEDQPLRVHGAVEIPMYFGTAGVIGHYPKGICYGDLTVPS